MITQRFNIDIVPNGSPVIVHLSQYDDDERLVFTLYSRIGELVIESGTTASISGMKPDGNGFHVDCTLEGTTVTVDVDKQMTAVAGKSLYELKLEKGEKVLSTSNFIVDVERAPLDRDTFPSDSVIRELYAIADRTDEIIEAAETFDTAREEIDRAVNIATEKADTAVANSTEALTKANNTENEVAEFGNVITNQNNRIAQLENNAENYVDNGYVENGVAYFEHNGTVLFEITGIGGGGGGGGGDYNNAKLTVTNTTGWLSTTIAEDGECAVNMNWSSLEDEIPTGNGTVRITDNGALKTSYEIQQGDITVDLTDLLAVGSNVVKVQISDVYGNARTINFNITVVALHISSSFDVSAPFTGTISFPYTPVGAVQKTVHFILDSNEIGTVSTSVSNRQMTYTIAQQSHGAHTLRVYFEATINENTVRSNELYYEMICVEPYNDNVIITSSFNRTKANQYESIVFPYTVYNPANLTSDVVLKVNGTQVASLTVDRTEQSFTYRANEAGTLTFSITSGETTKAITVTVQEVSIDVEAETENLALYLTSEGRNNSEQNPAIWRYNDIETTFNGMNWVSDGWVKDDDGITVLRLAGGSSINILYEPFKNDFRATGKTIEIEFATRDVLNYDAVIFACMSGGRGIELTAQKATLKSEQSEISMQYKEDEHVRISFVVEKRSEHRLLLIYINGIASGVIQYPDDDDFSQVTPVVISAGHPMCTVDLYNIRIYDNDLTRYQILNNWIADTQIGSELIDRYNHNNVYDEYGNIVIEKLPSDLPYMIITAEELPQSKGDKKTCSGSYHDPVYPSRSFTFEGCQIDVQGTSSQYYARKNYKMKFKGGFTLNNGSHADNYAINANAVPTDTFTMKADVASSEGANNVELARLYNDVIPYKTPAQTTNAKVRQGIDGFPMVIFWNDGNSTTFLGKYNFNNDKGTEEVFGFTEGDESWEIKNNTSSRVLWKSADYTGNDWLNDFEGRYPDEYKNPAQLSEFARWLVTTDRTQATNETLAEPVTYGEGDDAVTYTTDSAEYRLAKFKNEASSYMEMDSALFYYLFTELFLMVDSRAKNAFPSFIGGTINE